MFRAFRFLTREVRGMHQAAYILAGFSFGSQLLALVRERLFASTFGAAHTMDIYGAAFIVPDFIFATVASLFSLYALLPVLSRLEKDEEGLMISFLRDILVVFFAGMALISLIAFILAPYLSYIVAPGLSEDPASHAQLIFLMRILLLQPILLGISNTIAALTQLRHRFVLYSFSLLFYNVGIIFGILVLYPHMGLAGLGWGVVLGALMQTAVQIPFFMGEKPHGILSPNQIWNSVREVLLLSIPRTLALSVTQITKWALLAIASLLIPGSIAIFNYAFGLQSVPLTIIGVSYSVAAFPTLARLHARGERARFTEYIEAALRHIVFWTIPATVLVIVLRAQIVRVILGAGRFDWSATRLTAAALALFILALLAQSLTLLIARGYYASGNSRKPLYFGFADIVVSIVAAVGFLELFQHNFFIRAFIESILRVDDVAGTAVLMLALGYALGAIAEFLIGYVFFVRDFSLSSIQLRRLFFESFSASVIGGAAAYAVLSATGATGQINTTIWLVTQLLFAGGAGLFVTGVMLWLLNNRELGEAITTFTRRFRDAPQVALEPSDVS
jgi:putative peptidoglycan lipid II flippase